MLEKSEVSKKLQELLEKKPDKAERFYISEGFCVDFIQFSDRPFEGVNSIISNGVSNYCEASKFEFIVTFNPSSLVAGTDLNAFLATYIQLHYTVNSKGFSERNCFCVPGGLIRDYEYCGVYATHPCYFPRGVFSALDGVDFLWLVPIFRNEYEFIQRSGAEAFERYLEKNDPDMSLLNRSPLPL